MKMNYTSKSTNGKSFDAPRHKPRISLCIDGDERYYSCTDGGLIQFGDTQLEAFNALKVMRENTTRNN